MSPIRLTLLLIGFIAFSTFLTFLSLARTHPPGNAATENLDNSKQGAFRSFFSFRSPSSLFPPSAIISLTDDNSTFFLARPADFGPSLIEDGLSGQLWVGSGFGDETTGRGGAASEAEGELGCSDAPGWGNRERLPRMEVHVDQATGSNTIKKNADLAPHDVAVHGRLQVGDDPATVQDDGTDDYLNPIPGSASYVGKGRLQSKNVEGASSSSQHADIESLQEAAEIAGRVVLLSRGSCGFLEKVKWAQRRGAIAVIVGDNTRGGSLVTMYAKGDTSNVTIPSLFTSRTTAHLLSSLIPPEGLKDGSRGKDVERDNKRMLQARGAANPRVEARSKSVKGGELPPRTLASEQETDRMNCDAPRASGWRYKLGFAKSPSSFDDSRRPPSSGRLHWINEKWDEELSNHKSGSNADARGKITSQQKSGSNSAHKDGFEIGIQDWRDPDLISTLSGTPLTSMSTGIAAAPTVLKSRIAGKDGPDPSSDDSREFSGGSITPSSGQYDNADANPPSNSKGRSTSQKARPSPSHNLKGSNAAHNDRSACHASYEQTRDERWWLSKLFRSPPPAIPRTVDIDSALQTQLRRREQHSASSRSAKSSNKIGDDLSSRHQGLWVTLTPTTISTTPFFDTVLVLVVSPLVTLTVVYAMLLLRSRIRRRRWRAPKSVVDRLPVRTYHTMTRSSASSSSVHTPPNTSSPTSPLLQSISPYMSSRTAARSRSNSGNAAMSSSGDVSRPKFVTQSSKEDSQRQCKPKAKYHSKQIECVVCLEEYEDGHSKIMSLPCGHEFHAACM